jgi:hypothetical protein
LEFISLDLWEFISLDLIWGKIFTRLYLPIVDRGFFIVFPRLVYCDLPIYWRLFRDLLAFLWFLWYLGFRLSLYLAVLRRVCGDWGGWLLVFIVVIGCLFFQVFLSRLWHNLVYYL